MTTTTMTDHNRLVADADRAEAEAATALRSLRATAGRRPCECCGIEAEPHYYVVSLDGEWLCVECA
jgi:hypothetical protein